MKMIPIMNVMHVILLVIAVSEDLRLNVPVVLLDISYMKTNVLPLAQTTIMETTENVNHVTTGVKLVPDQPMETLVLVRIHSILIQMV